MKILDPYIREILDNSINTSRDIKDFIFETNSKLSQLNARIDEFENKVFGMETPINQCQDTIRDAFKEIDEIKDKLNIRDQ